MWNTYCFSTPTLVRLTFLNIAFISKLPGWLILNVVFQILYVFLISCDFCNNTLILPFCYFYIQASFVELAFHLKASVDSLSLDRREGTLCLLVWSFWSTSRTRDVTRSCTPLLYVLVVAHEWHCLATETAERKYCCTSWSSLAAKGKIMNFP